MSSRKYSPRVAVLLGLMALPAACTTTNIVIEGQGDGDDSAADMDASVEAMNDASTLDASMGALDAAMHDASNPGLDAGPWLDASVPEGGVDADVGDAQADSSLDGSPEAGEQTYGECDFSGIWVVREVTRSTMLGAGQITSRWHYYELTQTGDSLEVTKHYECGEETQGTYTTTLTESALSARMPHNSQVGRRGQVQQEPEACSLQMERFWTVRGANESEYVPSPRNSASTLTTVKASKPLPTSSQKTGAEDWEEDGQPGVAIDVSGIVVGTRNVAQRGWTEWFTADDFSIEPSTDWTDDLVVRMRFDAEENVLTPTTGLLTMLSVPDASAEHHVTLHFLGRTADDPRAKALVKNEKLDTCLAIQAALPAPSQL